MASKPKMPKPQEPARMPVPDDANARAAKRRRENELMSQRGRASTNLTQDDALSTLLGN